MWLRSADPISHSVTKRKWEDIRVVIFAPTCSTLLGNQAGNLLPWEISDCAATHTQSSQASYGAASMSAHAENWNAIIKLTHGEPLHSGAPSREKKWTKPQRLPKSIEYDNLTLILDIQIKLCLNKQKILNFYFLVYLSYCASRKTILLPIIRWKARRM